ncbi:S1 family peptidase [Paenibacillus pini]|uniref:Serine protease n=1 Tax=Paenibacillus pini JCM 16418 TaxID=1236976 RepID=W7YUF0_9BACL|nr:serine protease [Paenibacillus pini]GAF10853.1 hypothetical protein JCM16418_5079 [Paenibacillus pini JCM 16418]
MYKNILVIIITTISVLLFASTIVNAEESKKVYYTTGIVLKSELEKQKEKVVYIIAKFENDNYFIVGTGFFIKGGYIVTNDHLVNSHQKTLETVFYRTIYDGIVSDSKISKVIYENPESDIAILKTNQTDHCYFELSNEIQDGEQYKVIGNPIVDSNDVLSNESISELYFSNNKKQVLWRVREGVAISDTLIDKKYSERWSWEGETVVKIFNIETYQGNSGSPIIDIAGKVVSIVSGLRYFDNSTFGVIDMKLLEAVKEANINL